MTQTTRKFKTVVKDRLFYDRFEYSMGFSLGEVNCLRVLDHAHIDDMIHRRRQWQEIAQKRWSTVNQKNRVMLGVTYREITEKTVQDLHDLAELLLTCRAEFKLVVSVSQAYVYTNDLTLIDQLSNMPQLSYKTYSQAQITRPKGTIQLKQPRHQFRTYFKLAKLSTAQRDQLAAFLETQQTHVRLSPALTEWAALPFTRVQDYFFVDHDSESWVTMLNLVVPGVARKTMHIIPAK